MSQWYSKYLQVYEKPFSEARPVVVEEIRGKIAGLQTPDVLVLMNLISDKHSNKLDNWAEVNLFTRPRRFGKTWITYQWKNSEIKRWLYPS